MENRLGIGGNNPPNDADTLQQTLRENHDDQLQHAEKLIAAADRIPSEINDDETAGRAADFIKQVNASKKSLESIRVAEKEPYLNLGRVVDGFFKTVDTKLTGALSKAKMPLDNYTKRKAEAERQRLLKEAEEKRIQAEEQAKAAAAMEKAKQGEAANDMMMQATIAEAGAAKLESMANAKPAAISQTRSESGALASLRTTWVGEITDIATLDLETLRFHLSPDALQKAVNSFMRAGGRELKGARIFEHTETVVR